MRQGVCVSVHVPTGRSILVGSILMGVPTLVRSGASAGSNRDAGWCDAAIGAVAIRVHRWVRGGPPQEL